MTPQVAKLLPLLASDKDGEVLGAAAALVRTLKSAGHDLHDLAKRVTADQPQPTGNGTKTLWNMAEFVGPHPDSLEQRELEFIHDMLRRYRRGYRRLSVKQASWIGSIYARVYLATGGE